MFLEAHDHETDNVPQGTLVCRLKGPVDYTYQVEMWVQEWLHDSRLKATRRFYAFIGDTVYSSWARTQDSKVHYVGRHEQYNGEWKLPFLYPDATKITTAVLGREVKNFADAEQWAKQALSNDIATAVVLDDSGIFASWETGTEGFRLISKSKRAFPIQATT